MISGCILCEEVSGRDPLSVQLRGERARPLMESPHFVALPDIQPLVAGHTLIATKYQHPFVTGVWAALGEEFEGSPNV